MNDPRGEYKMEIAEQRVDDPYLMDENFKSNTRINFVGTSDCLV